MSLGKVKTEIPDAKVAVLEDARLGEFQLRVPVERDNYPRVLVRTLRHDSQEQKRIDDQTVNLLFKQEPGRGFDLMDYMSSGMPGSEIHRTIDPLFYVVFDSNRPTYTNPVQRSKITTHHPMRRGKKRILEESDIEVPTNYYGMGIKQKGSKFLEHFREAKLEKIQELYEALWTQPLDSVAEVLDRQTLFGQLVEDSDHFDAVRSLELGLNGLVEPYHHLSNMSKLISANILRSRWSGAIDRGIYYHDFMKIARAFVDSYERMTSSLASLNSDSREMQVLLVPLREITETGGPLNQTYRFLRSVVDSATLEYETLRAIFEKELERTGATKLEELEKYNPNKDPEVRARRRWQKGKVQGLYGYKSSYLKGLLDSFHSQNPVSHSESDIGYLDYVGSRLAAYTVMGEFIRNEGWTRPEILPGEEGVVDISNGWYPLTRLQYSPEVVRNDTQLNPQERIEIIDGVNAGGKTIDVKKTLLVTSLALTGSYVPAEQARISFFNRVRFRIRQTGMHYSGALVEELTELGRALSALGTPILIGLDETFTSTNEREGEALTYGLVRRLASDGMARALITSHYPALHEVLDDTQVTGVKFSHFGFQRAGSRLNFSYRKLGGPNREGDYAIAIAENEQISPGIIRHAKHYSEGLG